MTSCTVSTKEQLEQAKDSKVDEIVVIGKLADELQKAKKIAYAGAGTIAALIAAIAAIPFTGGISAFAAAPIAAFTGLEVAAIIVAASLGIGLIIAVFKDYEEIEYENGKLKLKKRK